MRDIITERDAYFLSEVAQKQMLSETPSAGKNDRTVRKAILSKL